MTPRLGTSFPWRVAPALCGAMGMIAIGTGRVNGHGDIHLQIMAVTESISRATNDASLYLKRGELYRLHKHFDAAHLDFKTAVTLSSNQWPVVHLARARLFLDMGWPLSAEDAANAFLRMEPESPEGFEVRAHARVQLEEPLSAAEDFTQAIDHQLSPGPQLYIDRARAFAAAGDDYLGRAIGSLDEGIESLGNLVTLQLPAIEFELDRRHFDEALRRLDVLAVQSPRKESWLHRRGEILLEAGRPEEARAAFQRALDALRSLPPSRRHVPDMVDLERKLLEHLKTTPSSLKPETES